MQFLPHLLRLNSRLLFRARRLGFHLLALLLLIFLRRYPDCRDASVHAHARRIVTALFFGVFVAKPAGTEIDERIRVKHTGLVRFGPFFQLVDVVVELLLTAFTLLEAALLELGVISLRDWYLVSQRSVTRRPETRGNDVKRQGFGNFDRLEALDLHSHCNVEGVVYFEQFFICRSDVLNERRSSHAQN